MLIKNIYSRSLLISVLFFTAITSAIAVPLDLPLAGSDANRNLLAGYTSIVSANAEGCATDAFQCWRVSVACADQDAREGLVEFRRGSGAIKGLGLFLGGGAGTGFWQGSNPDAISALADLNGAGFNTAQLKWDAAWTQAADNEPQGHKHTACRAASVAAYLYNQFIAGSTNRGFCVSGNSAGGSQVSYMLSHYGLGEIIDLATITSGPPMGRMDLGCVDDSADEFFYLDKLPINAAFSSAVTCSNAAQGDLASRDALRDASIAYGGVYNYSKTDLAFIYGSADDTNSVAQGMAYTSTLIQSGQSQITVDILPGVRHGLHQTTEGAAAIRDVFLNRCAPD